MPVMARLVVVVQVNDTITHMLGARVEVGALAAGPPFGRHAELGVLGAGFGGHVGGADVEG
jgi:hypothetical protein